MTKQKLLKELSYTLWDSDLLVSRVTLALAEFCWAVMLLWPGDTFGRPTYDYMSKVMSEELWGVIFLISSVTQITVVLLGDTHSRFSRYFAGWNACLWGYTVVSMLLSVYPPPAAIGGEISLGFAAVWIWIRPYILQKGYSSAGY